MSIFKQKLGIDLGTNEIVVYVPLKGVVLREPTVVAVSLMDKKIMAIGSDAREMLGKMPDSIIAIKPIKEGAISNYKVTVTMINHFINKALGKYSFFKPEVIVSVPSSISSTERRAVMEAILEAGAKEVYVVKEPVLAAIGSGVPIQEPVGRMIMNIGGGTTDIAVISLGGVVFSKSIKTGGNKFDESIVNMVRDKHQTVIGERSAEMIKISIGGAVHEKSEKVVKVKGRDFETGQPQEITIHKNEVVDAIMNDLQEIVKAAKDVFSETPPELASDIMDNGILLSGGGSLLSNLSEFLEKTLHIPAQVVEEPKLSVAYGMGVVLDHVDLYKRAVVSKKAGQ
jgi:rod shape-determining protein MreB